MKSCSMIVTLPGEAKGHANAERIVQKIHSLGQEFEKELNLEKVTIESRTESSEFCSLVITLPRETPLHPSFLPIWRKLCFFTNQIENELKLTGLGPRVEFVSMPEKN